MTRPANYYTISDNDEMENALIGKGMDIINRISLNTNTTMTAPLVASI